MTDPIHVTYDSLADLKAQLLSLSVALDNAAAGASTPAGASVSAGAGEFAGDLGDGVARFTTGWSMFLGATSDDASILGSSVGQASVDFHAVDAGSALDSTITL